MSITNKIRAGGIAVLALLILYIGLTIYAGLYYQEPEEGMINVYFYNPATNKLVAEKRYLPPLSYKETANYIWGLLLLGPENSNLSKVYPDGMTDESVEQIRVVSPAEDKGYRNIELYLYDDYLDVPPVQEIVFRSAFVWTFTELDWVNQVLFKINGAEFLRLDGLAVGAMDRYNTLIDTPITQEKRVRKTVTLYFADEDQTGLVAERRVIENIPSNVPIERIVLQELLLGPKTEGLINLIPADTTINDVGTEAMTCYVDLNPTFDNKLLPGTQARKLAIYSIVNTLTGLDTGSVSRVQFLINAERVAGRNLEIDLSQTFEADESLILIRMEEEEF